MNQVYECTLQSSLGALLMPLNGTKMEEDLYI